MKTFIEGLFGLILLSFICCGGCLLFTPWLGDAVEQAREGRERFEQENAASAIKSEAASIDTEIPEAPPSDNTPDENADASPESQESDEVPKVDSESIGRLAQVVAAKAVGKHYPSGNRLTQGWQLSIPPDGRLIFADRKDPEILSVMLERERIGDEIIWTCIAVQVGFEMVVSAKDPTDDFEVFREQAAP